MTIARTYKEPKFNIDQMTSHDDMIILDGVLISGSLTLPGFNPGWKISNHMVGRSLENE